MDSNTQINAAPFVGVPRPCSVIVDDPRFGTPYTLKIESVTADAVIVRRDPPYEGMSIFVGRGTRKEPDHPTQGYDRPSMNLVVQNMTKHRHPALSMFKAAYAQMLSQNSDYPEQNSR